MAGLTGLAGKVAIVTGGAAGLGRASAVRLAAEGARVLVVDRDADGAAATAESLPTESAWIAGDVASEADTERYLAAALDRWGRVDLHHLNAGIPGPIAGLPDLTTAEFDQVMDINVRGMFFGVRAAFRQYRAQRGGGTIVLTASIASLRGSADLFAYHVSKHAVLGILHGAAVYGGPLGIRVNAVAPGIVPTGLFAAAATTPGGGDDMVRRASTSPLRRAGTPEEIAAVVAFLLSDDSGYVTGEVVSADGGASVQSPVRPSGGAGAWDFAAVDAATYGSWSR
jgi:NAD(P)-dependent dehydrogenase (short-subunit alcohol dehydrogenase family)